MKLVDELKQRLIENIYTLEELDGIMEGAKYHFLEHDVYDEEESEDIEEDGIIKYTNGRSQIWIKYILGNNAEYLISDVTYKVKKSGKTQVHAFKNPQDIKKMMDYFRNNGENDWFLVFVLGITLGRRIGDTLSLKWSHFYYENGTKKYRSNDLVERKTGKTVEIKISHAVWQYLDWYMQKENISLAENLNHDIFDTADKADLRQQFLHNKLTKAEYEEQYAKLIKNQASLYRYALKKAAKFNGIEGVSTHSTRKTFGYWAHKLNPYDEDNLDVLQSIFGHSSRETTKIYIDIMSDKSEKIFDDISQFVSDVDAQKPIETENNPVIVLKTQDLREIINMAFQEGARADGDNFLKINHIISEAELRRVI